jgi:hypothetical protein
MRGAVLQRHARQHQGDCRSMDTSTSQRRATPKAQDVTHISTMTSSSPSQTLVSGASSSLAIDKFLLLDLPSAEPQADLHAWTSHYSPTELETENPSLLQTFASPPLATPSSLPPKASTFLPEWDASHAADSFLTSFGALPDGELPPHGVMTPSYDMFFGAEDRWPVWEQFVSSKPTEKRHCNILT